MTRYQAEDSFEKITRKSNKPRMYKQFKQCVGKARYRSEDAANRNARRSEELRGGKLHSYYCKLCRSWHIGNFSISEFD